MCLNIYRLANRPRAVSVHLSCPFGTCQCDSRSSQVDRRRSKPTKMIRFQPAATVQLVTSQLISWEADFASFIYLVIYQWTGVYQTSACFVSLMEQPRERDYASLWCTLTVAGGVASAGFIRSALVLIARCLFYFRDMKGNGGSHYRRTHGWNVRLYSPTVNTLIVNRIVSRYYYVTGRFVNGFTANCTNITLVDNSSHCKHKACITAALIGPVIHTVYIWQDSW